MNNFHIFYDNTALKIAAITSKASDLYLRERPDFALFNVSSKIKNLNDYNLICWIAFSQPQYPEYASLKNFKVRAFLF